jgi:hypothetical protein
VADITVVMQGVGATLQHLSQEIRGAPLRIAIQGMATGVNYGNFAVRSAVAEILRGNGSHW